MADSITLTEVSKMKVTELKKALKEKGLPLTGSKSDLQERLTLSLTADSESAATEPADAVLNETTKEASKPKKPVVQSIKPPAQPVKSPEEKPNEAAEPASNKPAEEKAASKPVSTTLSETERIKKRAERFGLVNQDAKKQARAERFGLPAEKASAGAGGGASAEVLKKRAERFGQVVSNTLVKASETERLQKRKERFGEVTSSSPAKFTKITYNSSPAEDEKKRQRAERFALS